MPKFQGEYALPFLLRKPIPVAVNLVYWRRSISYQSYELLSCHRFPPPHRNIPSLVRCLSLKQVSCIPMWIYSQQILVTAAMNMANDFKRIFTNWRNDISLCVYVCVCVCGALYHRRQSWVVGGRNPSDFGIGGRGRVVKYYYVIIAYLVQEVCSKVVTFRDK